MDFYAAIAMVTVGVASISGIINLLSGLYADGEKTELVFGILVLCIVFFLLFPPLGYIIEDKAPYPLSLCVKRIFMWAYYALLPVFFEYYSGYRRPLIKYGIWVLLGTSYLFMVFAQQDSMKPVWLMISLVMFAVVGFYGLAAAKNQIRNNKIKEGRWLLASMSIYWGLLLLGFVNQLGDNYFGKMLGSKLFFPFHFNMLAFILIMSVRLRTNTYERFQLEKILNWKDKRWNSLVDNLHLLIVELDAQGIVRFANPFALETLGYGGGRVLLAKSWFDEFAGKQEATDLKGLFYQAIKEGKTPANFLPHLLSKGGQPLSINWTTVFVFDKRGEINGTMNIGVDLTGQEKAYNDVQVLKNELEKEKLIIKEDQKADEIIIGNSDAIIYAINKARQVATTNAGVLLQGETGVGKELFADFIHKYSYRSSQALIKVNCAALPPELVESELFGHEKGSFTGAIQARVGRFELANGGTIFLDEIGELSLAIQSKLLRVLQNGEFERVGGQKTIKVNVRIIAATNRELQEESRVGKFREDLYYRLNVFPITIPPLRKRREDIPLLTASFLRKLAAEHNKTIDNISKADMARLVEFDWPGNIRELINLLERSIISSTGTTLRLDWGPAFLIPVVENDMLHSIHDIERTHIARILRECKGKINGIDGAAFRLGLHPNTLRSRLKKMNISRTNIDL